jgi:DNA-binding NarL/FixJ family response regulator
MRPNRARDNKDDMPGATCSPETDRRMLDVLIVDDEADIRFMLAFAVRTDPRLRVAGEAINGAHAIEMLKDGCPDAILLDVQMPVMSGIEAIHSIKQHCHDAKIVMYSAAGASQLVEQALDEGADLYLLKGTPPSKILDAVVDLCA